MGKEITADEGITAEDEKREKERGALLHKILGSGKGDGADIPKINLCF